MQLTNEEDLRSTVLNAPIGICILDAATLVVELLNDKFLEVAGKSPEAIIGHWYWEPFSEAKDLYETALNNVVKTGQSFYADEVPLMLIRNGHEEHIVVTFVYAPVTDAAGNIRKVTVWVLENTRQVNEREKVQAAKLAIQQERDRLREFFMQAPAGICILQGSELVFELVNPLYQELFPGRNLLGKPLLDAIPEVRNAPIWDILMGVYQSGKNFEGNDLLIPLARTANGPVEDRYFNFIYQARQDENSKTDGIIVFVIEVTGMIKVQEELRRAREEADQQKRIYETITSGTPDLMYVWDLNYHFTYVNSALLTMWGKTWDAAIGKGLRENGYEEWHAQMHEREIDHVKNTKESVRGEVSFPHAVLGKRVYDYILIPVLNALGEVEAVAGTTRDVTERKLMEEALAESKEELQAINEEMTATNEEMFATNEEQAASNEELTATNHELALVNQQLSDARQKIEESEVALRLAIEAANFGTWFIHSVTREFITDTRLKELFGYCPDEELSIEQALAQITDEYRGFVSNKLENAIYNGGDYDVTYPVVGLHDNRLRWLRAIGNLKADPSGAFSAFTGMVMDVTEQKANDQRKNDFIGMVSHELKTPLTSLTAIIQVANTKLKNSDDTFLAEAMDKANLQVKRMGTMINGFLNISRLESAQLQIDKKAFKLDQLIRDVVKETELTVSSHQIKLEHCDQITVEADQEKIGSVITNLISNAVKYSPKGKVVELNCNVIGNKVEVSVRDEGMGLKPADKEKVFDRYFRVESSHTQHISGFGIGLYLSAEIILQHNGKIWVESESGVGSTFYFSLPID